MTEKTQPPQDPSEWSEFSFWEKTRFVSGVIFIYIAAIVAVVPVFFGYDTVAGAVVMLVAGVVLMISAKFKNIRSIGIGQNTYIDFDKELTKKLAEALAKQPKSNDN